MLANGHSYTSNTAKLLKHLPMLHELQTSSKVRPVMIHIAPVSVCSLSCSYCVYAGRAEGESLSFEQVSSCLRGFHALGTRGLEWSVKGDEIIPLKDRSGYLRYATIQDIVRHHTAGRSFTVSDDLENEEDAITAHVSHQQIEPLWRVTLESGRHITTTKSHSIYFWDGERIEKKKLSDARAGDLVVVSVAAIEPDSRRSIGTKRARLLGYFTAEGSFGFQRDHVPHDISFTFGSGQKDEKYIKDVCGILDGMGQRYVVRDSDAPNKVQVIVCSKTLTEEFLSTGIGQLQRDRRVPDEVFNATRDEQIEYLCGFFAGDGHFRNQADGRGYTRNSLHAKVCSVHLQRTIGALLQQLGVWATFSRETNPERSIEGRTLAESQAYCINVYRRSELEKLSAVIHFMQKKMTYVDSIYSRDVPHRNYEEIGPGVMAIPIKTIDEVPAEDAVYDISVGRTHRFVSSFGILCSNTGGGEPTLWKPLRQAVMHAASLDFKQGLITNAIKFDWIGDCFDLLQWMRVSFHGFNENKAWIIAKNVELARSMNPNLTVSGVYIWTEGSEDVYPEVAAYAKAAKIPTRVTPDLTAGPQAIDKMMEHVRGVVEKHKNDYTFLSDFNVKTHRLHDRCYMSLVKPFIFTDGWVYDCPCIGLSPENEKNIGSKFRVCRIEDIAEHYAKPAAARHHACGFCKFSAQNELIDDILRPVEHTDFA